LLSAVCRNILSPAIAERIGTLVTAESIDWPEIALPRRSVLAGTETQIRLIPHLGESVLFKKRLDYETPVFRWLEQNVLEYDLVIDIWANIGVYSVFLDALIKSRPEARLQARHRF
jgi:hypothetical protein